MKWGQAAKLGRKSSTSALLIQLFGVTWRLCWQAQQTGPRLNKKPRMNDILTLDQHNTMKTSSRLDCINRTPARRLREVIILLYAARLRPYPQCCVQFWTLPRHQWTWVSSVKGHQDGQGLEHLPCKERLREQSLFSLQKRWCWRDLAAAIRHLQGGYWEDGAMLFTVMYTWRTKDNDKLKWATATLYNVN